MDIWRIADKILPPSPYGGPPLPNGLGIGWPKLIKDNWPTWAFTLSQKIAVERDRLMKFLGR